MPHSPRSIVETSHYVGILRQLKLSSREADELLRGVLFVVARSPRDGVRIAAGSHVWAIAFENPTASTQSYLLYYTFDSAKVFLLALRRSDEN